MNTILNPNLNNLIIENYTNIKSYIFNNLTYYTNNIIHDNNSNTILILLYKSNLISLLTDILTEFSFEHLNFRNNNDYNLIDIVIYDIIHFNKNNINLFKLLYNLYTLDPYYLHNLLIYKNTHTGNILIMNIIYLNNIKSSEMFNHIFHDNIHKIHHYTLIDILNITNYNNESFIHYLSKNNFFNLFFYIISQYNTLIDTTIFIKQHIRFLLHIDNTSDIKYYSNINYIKQIYKSIKNYCFFNINIKYTNIRELIFKFLNFKSAKSIILSSSDDDLFSLNLLSFIKYKDYGYRHLNKILKYLHNHRKNYFIKNINIIDIHVNTNILGYILLNKPKYNLIRFLLKNKSFYINIDNNFNNILHVMYNIKDKYFLYDLFHFFDTNHININNIINSHNIYNETPLHIACKHGNTYLIEFLLKYCFLDINKTDEFNKTPFYYLCNYKHSQEEKYRLEYTKNLFLKHHNFINT